jgi:hypothetical protein
MEDEPVELDRHRSSAGKMASEIRRHAIRDSEADQQALRLQNHELEAQLLAETSRTWPELAAKAQYLIRLYAETAEAQDERRQKLIERALGDIARLLDEGEH